MPKHKRRKQAPANPTQLAPFDEDDLVVVIVETPKGSRNKYAFDPKEHVFELKRYSRPAWTSPTTSASYPLDEPAFPGCKLTCRLISVIQGEQGEKSQRAGSAMTPGISRHSAAQQAPPC